MTSLRKIEENLNIFMVTSPKEFTKNYSIGEFKSIINSLPTTDMYLGMCVSLMDDFVEIEAFEQCAVLQKFLKTNSLVK